MIQESQVTGKEFPKVTTQKPISLAKIMVTTDFSPTSDRAMEYALSLARRHNSRIYLTHVVSVDLMMAPELMTTVQEKQRLAAKDTMESMVAAARLLDVPYEILIETGSVWPTIEALMAKHEIDLLIVGTHGVGAMQKILIGSTAEQIFRQSRVPVLTVGPKVDEEPFYEMEFRSILFATDFGLGAEKEAAYAFFLAQEHRSRLTVLNVVQGKKEVGETEKKTIARELQELIPHIDLHCLPTFQVVAGEPVEEILKISRKTQANLIVIGAKKQQGLAGYMPGSKAYKVVCGAPCPVLTIRS
jgi:nucleotide-binding universal stress UspA family protein